MLDKISTYMNRDLTWLLVKRLTVYSSIAVSPVEKELLVAGKIADQVQLLLGPGPSSQLHQMICFTFEFKKTNRFDLF